MITFKITWEKFKEQVDLRKLSIQWVDINSRYELYIIDGPFHLYSSIVKTDPKNLEQIDFEDNYKLNGNKSPKTEVLTQFEKDDKILKLFGKKQDTSSGTVTMEIKIPGNFELGDGRYIAGGKAWFTTPSAGDKITKVEVVDIDNILGYGANTVIRHWYDKDADVNEQGWYFPLLNSVLEVEPIGGYGFINSGLYLRIIGKKSSILLNDTLYVNLFWAKKE